MMAHRPTGSTHYEPTPIPLWTGTILFLIGSLLAAIQAALFAWNYAGLPGLTVWALVVGAILTLIGIAIK